MTEELRPYNLEELLKPRQILIANTGDLETIERERERLFGSVLNVLGYNPKEIDAFTSREYRTLHRYDTHDVQLPTDDRVTFLVARNRVVASLMETRDDFNYVQVSPASYLNPEMIKGIGEKHRG